MKLCEGGKRKKDGSLTQAGAPANALGQEFAKVLRALGLKRPGVSLYAIRHSFETIGGDTGDQIAVDAIMGHVPTGMSTLIASE